LDNLNVAIKKGKKHCTGLSNEGRRMLAMRNSPYFYCVKVYDVFIEEGYEYIVMEYCENGSLHHYLKRELSPNVYFFFFTKICIEGDTENW
jgi:serine/threonine protein kinase